MVQTGIENSGAARNTGLLAVDYSRLGQDDLAAPLLQKARGYMGHTDLMELLGPWHLQAGEPLDAVALYRALVERRAGPADEYATGTRQGAFSSFEDVCPFAGACA